MRRLKSNPKHATALLALGAIAAAAAPPGRATVPSSVPLLPDVTALSGRGIDVSVHEANGRFGGLAFRDRSSGETIELAEAFTLVLAGGTELRSTAMHAAPAGSDATAKPCWTFSTQHLRATWCVLVSSEAAYMRETLRIKAIDSSLPLSEVRLLEFSDPRAHVVGTVKGSPVVSGGRFYAFEHPLSSNTAAGGQVRAALERVLPLQAGQVVTYSAVMGASQPGQLRRAFLTYIERERPRPYSPFLHYNSWFDLGYTNRFGEEGALDRIHAFGTELVEKRHVQLDSFLFDDGWDDPNTLWRFNAGFPDGFEKAGEAAAEYHAGIGAWLSPWGGYDKQKQERVAYGRAHGYEILNDGYALSAPRYYKEFEQTCLAMLKLGNFNQFKFDGTGNADRVFPGSAYDSDFDAAIHLIGVLRAQKPGLFINLTTGTTASPFWLFYADSIWRGGEDHDFTGVGSSRQRWITYRDAETYKNIVKQGPLFPLNSLMLHGMIYAKSAHDLDTDPKAEFGDEVHSFFGSGTQLQEMYITPKLLSSSDWNTLAAGARWSRAHAETLKDTHWVGGDPGLLQVYGWAAWSPREAILTLRNPSDHPQTFSIDLPQALELPPGSPRRYTLADVWSPDRSPIVADGSGPLRIPLRPFEVLTLSGSAK